MMRDLWSEPARREEQLGTVGCVPGRPRKCLARATLMAVELRSGLSAGLHLGLAALEGIQFSARCAAGRARCLPLRISLRTSAGLATKGAPASPGCEPSTLLSTRPRQTLASGRAETRAQIHIPRAVAWPKPLRRARAAPGTHGWRLGDGALRKHWGTGAFQL